MAKRKKFSSDKKLDDKKLAKVTGGLNVPVRTAPVQSMPVIKTMPSKPGPIITGPLVPGSRGTGSGAGGGTLPTTKPQN